MLTGRPKPSNLEQINAELFALTYGSIVRQLIADMEDLEEVNKQLEQMGYNIGIRLIDEFLAKAKISKCGSFRDTAEVIAKQALPMFLDVTATVTNWSADGKECSLVLSDNPLTEWVELPAQYAELRYCNLLCGVIRGALDMVNLGVSVAWARDMLRGDDAYELRLKLVESRDEKYPYKEED